MSRRSSTVTRSASSAPLLLLRSRGAARGIQFPRISTCRTGRRLDQRLYACQTACTRRYAARAFKEREILAKKRCTLDGSLQRAVVTSRGILRPTYLRV